ncbi:hypothetical protein B5X24_HaOG203729 [Helicoverpa armigera]|uniref:Uncharacterized protein n=1 Tax=Helicoverpa armigera TaxID=29058 RepID=A0A2W1BPY7_HELAM|nr:hypothetical protein B5X24_HaOG203729 [Helicoverpa armigera]
MAILMYVICCEKFYKAVEEAKFTCTQLLCNTHCTNAQKQLYLKILESNTTFNKMSACGVFSVDAALPLCLIEIVANYTFVLLQFA